MEKYRIIYIEDNPTDFEMVKAVLEEEDILEDIKRVEKKEEFLYALENYDFDLILTDYDLPVFHGLEAISIVKQNFPDVPVIMITGNLPDEIAVDVIKKGAWDYILKENVFRLISSIKSAFERKKMHLERKEALSKLKEQEENYRILAESSPYGIMVHAKGRIIYHNKQAISIFREKKDSDFRGLRIIEFVEPAHQSLVEERMESIYEGREIQNIIELNFRNSKGEKILLEVASSPIFFNGYPAAQVIFRDIAERKEMEQHLILAKERAEESDRLKTAFLENLSHEIRTPLNGIMGFTSLLKMRDLSDEEKLNYINVIEESGTHLLNIIEDLIEISRIETNQVDIKNAEFNLNGLLDDIYVFYNEGSRYRDLPIKIIPVKPYPDHQAWIDADKSKLRQILNNLISNAYKFTNKGEIEFGYQLTSKGHLQFFVKDTGIGIPEDAREIIFERFRQLDNSSTRRFGGTGLGLAICKGLVESMKGKLWFNSEPQKGTIFYFDVPKKLYQKIEDNWQKHIDPANINWKGKKVLVAEDENSNFILLYHMLESTGIEIVHASTGKEVVDLIESGNRFDIILLDIKMPEMDGLEVIKRLRQQRCATPVIAQTAYAMVEDRDKCILSGCNDYITKPIKSAELLNKINHYLSG